ncbi:MAG: chemotaxis protein CheX [Clostridiales bacterium]|nr:chemotaxis protein CheX [Clostridiales bacterium]
MDTVMPEEKLREVLDQIARKVTEDSVGIRLVQREPELGSDICTVHISFRQGFRSSLSLRADTAMLTHLTQSMLKEDSVTSQDLEDVAKEYLNVLCGHIAAALYRATRVVARFSVPSFHRGTYSPEDHREQFVLSYVGDRAGTAQLVHHVPTAREGGEGTI